MNTEVQAPVLVQPSDDLREAIQHVCEQSLPEDLQYWVSEYATVGHRNTFLWKWCLEGVRLTTLSCVQPELRDPNNVTKVLGVMLDVLLDDVADRSGHTDFLNHLLAIPFAEEAPDPDVLSSEERAYAKMTRRIWETIIARAQSYPRYAEFCDLLRFDYRQLLNAMRYSHLVNSDPRMLNLVEHDLYLPHNMHMMISGTLDLMCSPRFDVDELGKVREVLWYAQCMGRIGNLVTTWERELGESDWTSGVFARALQLDLLSPEDLARPNVQYIREQITLHDCESYFLERRIQHRDQIELRARDIVSVDVRRLLAGLERLFTLHMGSRGLK